ncbi:RNA dependent RNA polymerase-domain-containing protein [Mycena floridula]|nr:RNA dependent RNA polymerase-domain-containing protein [Mycena floridula]
MTVSIGRRAIRHDTSNSIRLYGVVDEHRVLEEDEVYINIPHRAGVIITQVAVSRNPAYASGDIRVLNAVNKLELSHLQNCIVFPSSGRRSIPDMMGGGDLDGDEYWITWDPRLVPEKAALPQSRPSPPTKRPGPQRTMSPLAPIVCGNSKWPVAGQMSWMYEAVGVDALYVFGPVM